jgi:hypothetical protein
MIIAVIVTILVLLIVIFIIAVWTRPSQFRIARAATIDAPAPAVHANINDFHRWQAWSPWAKLDPGAKNSYDGPASGTGAGFGWDGNGKVGAGHMTIVASAPNRITIRLDFTRPFTATNTAEFTIAAVGAQTQVTWAMSGHAPFMMKAMCLLFFDQDKLIGTMFEQGLANLKDISEKTA